MTKQKPAGFSPAKKIVFLVTLIALIVAAYVAYHKAATPASPPLHEYATLLKQTASAALIANSIAAPPEEDDDPSLRLQQMLEQGIRTEQGILQSALTTASGLEQHGLTLNGQALKIQAVSPISLQRAFLLGRKQILLFSYDQGGNQCSQLYQILTIDQQGTTISNAFGDCLPLSSIEESNGQLIFNMPQNNPYLGADVLISYKYQDGKVSLLSKATSSELKQKYADLSATKILQQASLDGCYIDGVILDDNSCDGGRKYCVMFKHLSAAQTGSDYQLLKSFCN